MTARADGTAASSPGLPLDVLSRRVREARAAVHRHRHGPVASNELAAARRDLMLALEDYTTALEQRCLPVPYALRTELQLHRQLFRW
jgi:hypothetical protein